MRISPDGGHEPIWSRDGKELFYQQVPKLRGAAVVSTSLDLRFSRPRVRFEGGFVPYQTLTSPRTYDAGPDGRFVMIAKPDQPLSLLRVVTGWTDLLKARAARR